jgi:hypothetical protein
MKPVSTEIDSGKPEIPVLSPNPAVKEIGCLLPGNMGGDIRVTIFNQSGKMVTDYYAVYYPGIKHIIDLSEFSAGMYFVTFRNQSGGISYTSKFIKTGGE